MTKSHGLINATEVEVTCNCSLWWQSNISKKQK